MTNPDRPPGLTCQDLSEIARAALRSRHPGFTDRELDLALERVLGGHDVAAEARRWRLSQPGLESPFAVVR